MLALGAHRTDKLLVAEAALVRHIVVLGDDILLVVGRVVLALLELLVHLPAVLVVAAVVHELTGVAEAAIARLLVVLWNRER